jgi:hypothetical protein
METDIIQMKLNRIVNNFNLEMDNPECKITSFNWNGRLDDFLIEFYVGDSKYNFRINDDLCKQKGFNTDGMDVITQFEKEINYLKRAYIRGIYSKDYLSFTNWENEKTYERSE